jgi:hypothetical protein
VKNKLCIVGAAFKARIGGPLPCYLFVIPTVRLDVIFVCIY